MASVMINQVRRGFYLDSVALMRVARTIGLMPGVAESALMMGTAANRQIMQDAGVLDAEGASAEGNDLVVAVRADSQTAADEAIAEAIRQLDQPKTQTETASWRPRTLRQAVKSAPASNFALISVPGDYAIAEARKAVRHGLHAMIFSDNVPVDAERALKEEAREAGRLVMGPDCGTAIIGGVPLAFANVVPRGDIGIIGASGTGIQEVSCLIAQNGGGISHAIGVGGRDLSAEVGGITTLMAMDLLERGSGTRHIVLISKPPATDVARQVIERIAKSSKPYTVCFVGAENVAVPDNAAAAATLKAAAEQSLGDRAFPNFDTLPVSVPEGRRAVGLFSGGTLCAEAQIVFRDARLPLGSNAPIPGVAALGENSRGHAFIDLGDDEFTRGKPHPMIDPSVRDDLLCETLSDPSVGAILIDIVIGYGAHEDPAGHLAGVLASVGGERPIVVASVTGTDEDPQGRAAQVATLEAAGVVVAPSNADAAIYALACVEPVA
ncbi:MAG: acyl-CoA synthetase FdrA [Alphaproteobacteria bacterium]|nr:acyl-CoA synthetase FdrA [Alphaproteobacteria bacterium]